LFPEAWIKPSRTGVSQNLIAKWDAIGETPEQKSYVLGLDEGNHVYVGISRDGTDGGALSVNSTTVIPVNGWSHVVGTYNGEDLTIYVNGTRNNSVSFGTTGQVFPGHDDLSIGAVVGGLPSGQVAWSFQGLIDEPAVYNRALTAPEVLAIRQAGAAGKCKAFPIILTQPASQRVTLGSNATFSVIAAGATPFRYQWFHNSVAQPGATNSSYSFLVQSNSAGLYFVRVTNVFGTATSFSVLLTINNPPIAQPGQISLNEDTPAPIVLHGTDLQLDPLGERPRHQGTVRPAGGLPLPAHGIAK